MKKSLLHAKNLIAAAMIFSTGLVNAQQWLTTGNSGTSNLNYVGTTGVATLFLRVNGSSSNPGQASLTGSGSFVVDGANNSNTINSKGSLIAGLGHVLGTSAESSIVGGWENNLSASGGANLVVGQQNTVLNGAGNGGNKYYYKTGQ